VTAAPERIVPTVAPPTVATYTLTSDGRELGPELSVLSLVVEREVNRIPTATLIIRDGKVSEQTFAVSESEDFAPGKKITIAAGYRATNEDIFSGIVVSQQLKIREQRSVLVVTLKDAVHTLTIGRRSRYFTEQSDSDAWESIVFAAGLEIDAESTDGVVPELAQHRSTDWDFLLSRVEANGMVAVANDGKLTIGKPAVVRLPVLKLEFGANLLSFDAELDTRRQYGEIAAYAWSSAEGEAISETATGPGEHPIELHHGGGLAAAALGRWAGATAERSELATIRAAATFQGTAAVTVGDTVELAGMGERFNGRIYVAALRHEIADGQWKTTAQLGLREEWFTERFPVSAPPAGGLLPAVSGLHAATVVQMHDDPAGEERILVTIPAINPEGEGNWARLATGVGGSGAGLTFRPAVGEEVLVGFLDDDPRYPVILGGLHSSDSPAPLEPTEDNDRAGYVSRGGNSLVIDDTAISLELTTDKGDRLSLLGKDGAIELEDQHGNTISLSSSGITIESKSDLKLKAGGGVEIEGATVKIKASATGEFQAGAPLTLKGSLVQIN
jgi:phage protein D/phage baseplate assembly protein gpV